MITSGFNQDAGFVLFIFLSAMGAFTSFPFLISIFPLSACSI